VKLEQNMLLLANYRQECFRRNASNGITVHTGSAVRAVGLRRGYEIVGKICENEASTFDGQRTRTTEYTRRGIMRSAKMETVLQVTARVTIYCTVVQDIGYLSA